MKIVLFFIPILFFAFASNATVVTGHYYLEVYEQHEEGNQGATNFLHGFVAGLFDAYEEQLSKCTGENVMMRQFRDGIGTFLKTEPAFREYSVASYFVRLVKLEWNCQ